MHKTLAGQYPKTSSLTAGIIDRVWTIEKIVELYVWIMGKAYTKLEADLIFLPIELPLMLFVTRPNESKELSQRADTSLLICRLDKNKS